MVPTGFKGCFPSLLAKSLLMSISPPDHKLKHCFFANIAPLPSFSRLVSCHSDLNLFPFIKSYFKKYLHHHKAGCPLIQTVLYFSHSQLFLDFPLLGCRKAYRQPKVYWRNILGQNWSCWDRHWGKVVQSTQLQVVLCKQCWWHWHKVCVNLQCNASIHSKF